MKQESVTFEQLMREAMQSRPPLVVEGTAEEVKPAPKPPAQTGTEMLKSRLRITLDFDVSVNDGKIRHSGNDTEIKNLDLALLQKFLTADKAALQEMLAYTAGVELGLNSCESFIEMFLGQIDFGNGSMERRLFGPAIAAMQGEAGDYWRGVVAQPKDKWGDVLSLCTESLFECFKAEFVASSAEIVEE